MTNSLPKSQHGGVSVTDRKPTYWRVEGSLLELGALRPVGFFTWNARSFSERWARRAGMAGMALARPFARSRGAAAGTFRVARGRFRRRTSPKRKAVEPARLVTKTRAFGKRYSGDRSTSIGNSEAGGGFRRRAASRGTFGARNAGGAAHFADWRHRFYWQGLAGRFARK